MERDMRRVQAGTSAYMFIQGARTELHVSLNLHHVDPWETILLSVTRRKVLLISTGFFSFDAQVYPATSAAEVTRIEPFQALRLWLRGPSVEQVHEDSFETLARAGGPVQANASG